MLLRTVQAVVKDLPAIIVVHVQAVFHHYRGRRQFQPGASLVEHVHHARSFEYQFAVELVVLFVYGAAGDQQFDGHFYAGLPLLMIADSI